MKKWAIYTPAYVFLTSLPIPPTMPDDDTKAIKRVFGYGYSPVDVTSKRGGAAIIKSLSDDVRSASFPVVRLIAL